MNLPRIAIDAMGGDEGVRVMIDGASMARRRHDKFKFLLVGDRARIESALEDHPGMAEASDILHADDVVEGDEKPSKALRRAKTTSMGLAVNAVKAGEAGAAVSAGNTGALMAMSKLALRTMPGIDRPALAALLPTLEEQDVIMLDLGANRECDARNLVQFAIMGAAYSRIVTGCAAPRVRLLNIGTEETKGTEELQDAAAILRAATGLEMKFEGYVEADKINRGNVDVVVTDGFSGNIALKAIEGTARFVTDLLRQAFSSSIRSKMGFLVSRPATELLRHHLDPNNHNGAVFLGLNGVVVKSHGSANAKGVANAVEVAARLLEDDITNRIARDLGELGRRCAARSRKRRGGREVIRSVLRGTGSALPAKAVSNAELADRVDTSDEWIVERTGIRQRYIADDTETTSSLAIDASRKALEAAGIDASEIGLIILATATPDHTFPATATQVQKALGCRGGIAFDVQAVCSGFLYALATADSMLRTGMATKALVIGAETFSRILDWEDRTTCVLFGDGAGAVVLEAQDVAEDGPGILGCRLHADGEHKDMLYVDGGPSTTGTVGKLRMRGREVFRHAVVNLAEVLGEVVSDTGVAVEDIDWIVPHQANARILDATARKLGLAPEKVIVTVDQHANTSAASVPLALDVAVRDGRIKPGDLVMFEAMGGGFTWGAALARM